MTRTVRLALVGLDSSHADQYVRLLNVEQRFPGVRVTVLADGDPGRVAELAARSAAAGVPVRAGGPDDVASVDAVVVAHRAGRLHHAAALPFVRAGLPVLVDKPFTAAVADAEDLVTAARASGSVLTSCSALRFVPDVAPLRATALAHGRITTLTLSGPADPGSPHDGLHFLGIHLVEAARSLLGGDADLTWGEPAVGPENDAVTATVTATTGGRDVVVRLRLVDPAQHPTHPFHAALTTTGGTVDGTLDVGPDYLEPVLAHFLDQVAGTLAADTRAQLVGPVALLAAVQAAVQAPSRAGSARSA
ncbi:Gfo/Idh/MocA family oxidoreductase [Oerskovia jenensis]|uniref:Dehydrogenase n=1 Tax=Oerskovia jenensis TaxID=162169 RepID=A0ABS2LAU7_9CELL|nr:Gfo/Idh/MocA family oxidoreductase [Oerskovia jenensis]MBM7477553.1 putative dehydrogenase [Oerskovia jenensis]